MKLRRTEQLSVYLENRVGALADLCGIIARQSINLVAICAIDTVEEAVLRIVPEDAITAKKALEASGYRVLETEVLVVELPNVPGATGTMAASLAERSINIDYIYASTHPEEKKTLLILRTHAIAEAEKALTGA